MNARFSTIFTISFSLLILCMSTQNSKGQVNVLDSMIYQEYWQGQGIFKNNLLQVYNYTGIKATGVDYFTWRHGAGLWHNDGRDTKTYNSFGQLESNTHEKLDSTTWISQYRETLFYNTAPRITRWLVQQWQTGGSVWEDSIKWDFQYQNDTTLLADTTFRWTGTQWDYDVLTRYTHSGNSITYSLSFYWNSTSWDTMQQRFYYPRGPYGYDSIRTQYWDGFAWENEYLETYYFDIFDNLIQYDNFYWDGGVNGWFGDSYYYTYYSSFLPWRDLHLNTYYYAGNSYTDTIGLYTYIWRQIQVGIDELSGAEPTFDVYPNPIAEEADVQVYLPEDQAVVIEVHDLFGRKFDQMHIGMLPAGDHLIKWSLSGKKIPPGNYLMRVDLGQIRQVKQIVIVK